MGIENGANGHVSIKTQLNCIKIRIFVNSETELSTQMVSFLHCCCVYYIVGL